MKFRVHPASSKSGFYLERLPIGCIINIIVMKNISILIMISLGGLLATTSSALEHRGDSHDTSLFVLHPSETGLFEAGSEQITEQQVLSRVGKVDGHGMAIYLGNGTVITAGHNHVRDILFGTVWHSAIEGSANRLGKGQADLITYKVEIPESSPLRDMGRLGIAPAVHASELLLLTTSEGWGMNLRSSEGRTILDLDNNRTRVFSAQARPNLPVSSQASFGDSGGAAFLFDADSGSWKLGGVILALSRSGFPETIVGDVSTYQSEIEHAIESAPPPALVSRLIGTSKDVRRWWRTAGSARLVSSAFATATLLSLIAFTAVRAFAVQTKARIEPNQTGRIQLTPQSLTRAGSGADWRTVL